MITIRHDRRPPLALATSPVVLTFQGYNLHTFRRSDAFPRPYPVSIADIQRVAAMHFRIPVREMWSARRSREVARPRQVAMYLCRELTRFSLPAIGRRFGARDHTTVIHAIRQIDKLRLADGELDADVRALTARLSA
jgi:chromosomal replication initiation ATPase DnaA